MSLFGFDRPGEHLHPRFEHRVVLVLLVQRHRAVVGIDGGLHRVTDVRHLLVGRQPVERHLGGVGGRRRQRRELGVRVVVQRGVTVDDPHQPLVDDRRVYAAVGRQPRRHRLHPLRRIAVEQDLAVGSDHVGEQEVSLGELRREHAARQPAAKRDAPAAAVGVVLGLGVGLVVVLPVDTVLADDRVVGGRAGDDRSVVDARLVQRRRTGGHHAAVGADDAGQELGVSAVLVGVVGDTAHGVGRRGDEPLPWV